MSLGKLGEFGLIERLACRLAKEPAQPAEGAVTLGIGDDASVLRVPVGAELVATADALVEGVHFRRDWSRPEDIGWKSLAVNVSDLAAMGASPLGALITLALPADVPVPWVDRFYEGLGACAREYGCPIVGGDTVRALKHLAVSVTALGTVPEGSATSRDGARVGDLICVTGVLGGSGAGLALLESGRARSRKYRSLLERHRRPRPPVEAGTLLASTGLARAMMDLSDGLGSDLRHLAKASGVGARIYLNRLPISDDARQAGSELGIPAEEWALFGGEDYELLFTVAPERFSEVPPLLGPIGVAATIIGDVSSRKVTVVDANTRERPLRPEGFRHFSS